jgi:hypothetical protein
MDATTPHGEFHFRIFGALAARAGNSGNELSSR